MRTPTQRDTVGDTTPKDADEIGSTNRFDSVSWREPTTAPSLARVLRGALIALVPASIAFVADELVLASTGAFWLPMTAAVVVSAANGGMVTGLVATMTSAALVWWFFVPHMQTLGATEPAYILALAVFLAVGFAVSLLHEKLHRMRAGLARAARQNHIFAALIENSLDFIGIADPEGKPRYLNSAGRRMVELPNDIEIERTKIADYYPADVRAFAQDTILAAMQSQGKWAGETTFRNWRTDGPIPVLDTHFLIRDPVTQRVIGMATITRDISAQKAQRDALEQANQRAATAMHDLRESQRSLQGILDYSPNAIVIKSLEGRYIIVNNGFSAIRHLEPDEARGKSDADLFPPELAQRLRANDADALSTGKAVVTEEVLAEDGEQRVFVVTKFPLLDDENTIYAIGAIWTDISQRKRDEEALAQVANDLREAQRVAHVGSWRFDARTQQTVWSEELYHIYGLDPAQPRQKPLYDDPKMTMFTAEGRELVRGAVAKALADGLPYELELEFTRPDGTTGWVVGRGEAIRDGDGRIIGISGTAADITKLKELQRLRDEWTSVIAHDLRQPISTILMASDFLPEVQGDMTDKERTLVESVHAAGLTLKRMVDDLLDMSLLEANRLKLERTATKPASLVQDTLGRLAHLPGIERVHVSSDANLTPVFVDPMRIEQVITNLVTNAIKYGDEHTDIDIRVTQRAKASEIAVTNRGPGIAPEELPRLFNRFMRSKKVRGSGIAGLGLGLYIAKGVVEAHDGQLWAESTPGETTTFHLTLPLAAEMRQAA